MAVPIGIAALLTATWVIALGIGVAMMRDARLYTGSRIASVVAVIGLALAAVAVCQLVRLTSALRFILVAVISG